MTDNLCASAKSKMPSFPHFNPRISSWSPFLPTRLVSLLVPMPTSAGPCHPRSSKLLKQAVNSIFRPRVPRPERACRGPDPFQNLVISKPNGLLQGLRSPPSLPGVGSTYADWRRMWPAPRNACVCAARTLSLPDNVAPICIEEMPATISFVFWRN